MYFFFVFIPFPPPSNALPPMQFTALIISWCSFCPRLQVHAAHLTLEYQQLRLFVATLQMKLEIPVYLIMRMDPGPRLSMSLTLRVGFTSIFIWSMNSDFSWFLKISPRMPCNSVPNSFHRARMHPWGATNMADGGFDRTGDVTSSLFSPTTLFSSICIALVLSNMQKN